ncbi:YeeE/YedE family protein [Oricola sp.]|uniref:YeeE/YedE family protein n=1 Tax=Oricola sp. TaxID=1979950 RepID=UPI0025EB877B|nr:YeeE/YedE family protein [Oricola sp.]MCI5077039.1 YeeE/YedE family protein [Oricola sp.]
MIETWREIVVESAAFYIGWGGLLIGVVFGFLVYTTNFCTMGSISDIISFGSYNRFRAWLLACAVAIIGVAFIEGHGVADTAESMYQTPNLAWLANVVGGLLFGFGMVFAGGCISRNLVRAGGGDLRSVVVLIITGIFAFITIGGILGPLRVALFDPMTVDLTQIGMETQRIGEFVGLQTGVDVETARLWTVFIIAGILLIYCFADRNFLASPRDLIAGLGIGLCIVAGWFLTGLAADEFADIPVQLISLSYVRPTGDTLDYLMRFTALGAPGFGIATTAGALLGGFLGAASSGRLGLTSFADAQDSVRNMFGAALMGIGGVLALGCTVGQALTGFSTLAIGSAITFGAILVGGMIGVKTMERIA